MKLNFSGTAKKAPEIVGISDPSALNIEGTLEIPDGYTLVKDTAAREHVAHQLKTYCYMRFSGLGGASGSDEKYHARVRELRNDYGTVMVDEELAKLVGLPYIA